MRPNTQQNATHNALNDDHSLYYTQAIAETYAITENNEIDRELTNLKAVRIARVAQVVT